METPICDFVARYAAGDTLRLHMPGHKGKVLLGPEPMDLTEIPGADSLYDPQGIIHQSEENAGRLFGCHTFYSTEGSSHCIRAMLTLALQQAVRQGKAPVIAAARNAHKAFIHAVALLDLQVQWLDPGKGESYLSCCPSPRQVDDFLRAAPEKPFAVYLTSPDYLGCLGDIEGIAQVCHQHGCLLLVDNAHGAYLRFLEQSLHPMDLGADLCCDSAHKTLPVLTGGAYLHISYHAPQQVASQAKNALALHGSTSPSYLILQSLDRANAWLDQGYVKTYAARAEVLRHRLEQKGLAFYGQEPLKLTLKANAMGYTGLELGQRLRQQGIECEFADPAYVVLMPSATMTEEELDRLEEILAAIELREPVQQETPAFHRCRPVMSVRQAMLSPAKTVRVEDSLGRILAAPSVSCPPAVPIVVCGEQIDQTAVELLRLYGVERCTVVDQ